MTTPVECTLLDLMRAVTTITDDDHQVAALVASLVNSGQVRLKGAFAGAKVTLSSSLSTFPKVLWPSLLGVPTALSPAQPASAVSGVRGSTLSS